jgi:uncharacterized membrane protein
MCHLNVLQHQFKRLNFQGVQRTLKLIHRQRLLPQITVTHGTRLPVDGVEHLLVVGVRVIVNNDRVFIALMNQPLNE